MYKYLLCMVMIIGCSSASFDVAPESNEDVACVDSCSDVINTDSILSETDNVIEASSDSQTDSGPFLTDSLVADTNDANLDSKVTDTYVSPPVDTGPSCIPKTCSSLLSSTGRQPCGVIPDGCGGVVSCPTVCANHKES